MEADFCFLRSAYLSIRRCAVHLSGGRSAAGYIGDGNMLQEMQKPLKGAWTASHEQQLLCRWTQTSGEKTTETCWEPSRANQMLNKGCSNKSESNEL